MIGRRTTAGLALLCALMFSAFATQSASAQKGTAAINTTAFTCVLGGGNLDFTDKHCNNKVEAGFGGFGHVAIKSGETKAIDVSNEGNAVLTSTHLGVTIEISCTTVKTWKAWLENSAFLGEHKVKGTVSIEFTGCTVAKPAKCTVKEPIETIAVINGVEGLKFGATLKAMGLEFTQDEGKNFAEISFEGGFCAFKAKTFPVTGSAVATGTPNPGLETKQSGATSNFESANEMDTLKFSTSNADFKGTFAIKGFAGGSPIALTTVT